MQEVRVPTGQLPLSDTDADIYRLIRQEAKREHESVRLIASENYASRAVMEATGSCLTNKYSEGYAGKRYYEGQHVIDEVETLAINRIKDLFGAEHVNVQPYSGSPANLAVYLAFLQAGDTVMGLGLPAGGHLTHGHSVSITGRYFNSVPYGVRESDCRIDMDQVRALAKEHRPKLIWAGTTAYPRTLDWAAFRSIADEVGAILAADIAHIAGLVSAKLHPSPVGIADVVTSTTHKTFRGPRGGMIMCKSEHAKAIDRAVFPGLQGGPHNHTTAAIAVAAKEASLPDFVQYAQLVIDNAKALAESLAERGFSIVTGGTDNHLLLVDLTTRTSKRSQADTGAEGASTASVGGKPIAQALDRAGIVANYNAVPFDKRKPFDPSGLRIGTAAISSRGMRPSEMKQIAAWIERVVDNLDNETVLRQTSEEVRDLCTQFVAPGILVG